MKKILNSQLTCRWFGMLSCSCDVIVMTYHSSWINPGREHYDLISILAVATEPSHQHHNSASIPNVPDQSCIRKIIIFQVTTLAIKNLFWRKCDPSFRGLTALGISNSLCPGHVMQWHWSVSTVTQVTACCLMALCCYLNECWLIIKMLCDIYLRAPFGDYTFKIIATSSRGQWVNDQLYWSITQPWKHSAAGHPTFAMEYSANIISCWGCKTGMETS